LWPAPSANRASGARQPGAELSYQISYRVSYRIKGIQDITAPGRAERGRAVQDKIARTFGQE